MQLNEGRVDVIIWIREKKPVSAYLSNRLCCRTSLRCPTACYLYGRSPNLRTGCEKLSRPLSRPCRAHVPARGAVHSRGGTRGRYERRTVGNQSEIPGDACPRRPTSLRCVDFDMTNIRRRDLGLMQCSQRRPCRQEPQPITQRCYHCSRSRFDWEATAEGMPASARGAEWRRHSVLL